MDTFKGNWEIEEKASKLHTQKVSPEDLLPCNAYFHLLLLPFDYLVYVSCCF